MSEDLQRRQDLADFLRTRRARLSPAEVGLPVGKRRRTQGLRREEVAELANVGVSWYTSLEQGRDIHPSLEIMQSLATALQLSLAERQHLFLLAGQPSEIIAPDEEVSPILQHILDNLDPSPAYVMGRRWDYLAWNKAAEEVFLPERGQEPYARNIVWKIFTDLNRHLYYERWEQTARIILAEFRSETAHYADEDWFQQFISEIQEASSEFRNWWPQHDVRKRSEGHKEILHSFVGSLWFEHTTLQLPANPDLKVMIYTPLATTDTAAKLCQIREAQVKSPV